jgi:N-acyl-D-aspartate/D-glutamate deacylase
MTSDTARLYGLHDRGIIAPGMKADFNVIDMDELALAQPTMAYDLPGGARRLLQRARGYKHTIVSGATVMCDGEATEARPGRLVRGPQSAPSHN